MSFCTIVLINTITMLHMKCFYLRPRNCRKSLRFNLCGRKIPTLVLLQQDKKLIRCSCLFWSSKWVCAMLCALSPSSRGGAKRRNWSQASKSPRVDIVAVYVFSAPAPQTKRSVRFSWGKSNQSSFQGFQPINRKEMNIDWTRVS